MYNLDKEDELFKKVMTRLDQKEPFKFPNTEKFTNWVRRLGALKLKTLLIKEVQERYNAEKTLSDYGFIQNNKGRWITPEELRQALEDE